MLSENKLVKFLNNVLFIFGVLLVERLDELCFDEPLFVESLFVFEDFERDKLLILMVERSNNYSE